MYVKICIIELENYKKYEEKAMEIKKKEKKGRKIILLLILTLFLVKGITVIKEWKLIKRNKYLLERSILNNKEKNEILLNELIPFEWDRILTFSPYYSRDSVYHSAGYRFASIVVDGSNESFNQFVFMKDDKVVCHLQGLASNMEYSFYFNFDNSKDGVLTILNNKDIKMKVDKYDNGIVMTEEA